jgi:hypothetical protein
MNIPVAPNSVARICPLNRADQEIRLRAFVQFTLRQTRTNCYSPDRAMQLLDRAWEAQKLLWRLRIQGCFEST